MGTRIRVLLADDHETVRQGLRMLVDSQPDMAVVAEAGSGREALTCFSATHPDVVVMDVSMPDMNGLEATRALKQAAPDSIVIVLSRHGDDAYVQQLLSAGATAYVLKRSASSELLNAIRQAAAGHQYLDPALTWESEEMVLPGARAAAGTRVVHVSERESDVLRLMALGHSNKEIASSLDLSVKTIEVHKANAMRKLSLRGRIDVVQYAVLKGWLRDT